MVDDGDAAVLFAQHKVGDAYEWMAEDVDLKAVFHGEDLRVAKAVEALEVRPAFLVILSGQPAWKRREVVPDRMAVLVFIGFRQFKGHELAFGPALQDAVAVRAVLGIGVILLRHAVDVLEFERLRALLKERDLRKRPLHVFRDADAHKRISSESVSQNGCGASAMRTA